MPRYSSILLDHFQNPRNLGRLDVPDGTARIANPICGDEMQLDIRVALGRVVDCRFQARGCTAAVAAGSLVTVMLKGKTLEEALNIKAEDIVQALGGLPPEKLHCSILGHEAIAAAISDFRSRQRNPGEKELE